MAGSRNETPEQRQARLYREAVGEKAAVRQVTGAKMIYPCCGWVRENGHHPMCVNAPKERVA